jgi:hypothetical protein
MSASRSDASRTKRKLVKTRQSRATEERPSASEAPWVSLEDGNADKEAEVLLPSPNFYVLSGLFKEKGKRKEKKIYITRYDNVIIPTGTSQSYE